jgi:hypothetical protein
MDTTGMNPTFQIRDIQSPYGVLRDSIPLPGDVVTQMAASITALMSSFAPHILLTPGTVTITLDEGRGFGIAQAVTLTNNGSYGSVLGVSITSSAAYVTATPTSVGGLAAGLVGRFSVNADSTALLAVNSPYSATLTIQDPNATNNPQTVGVTVVVRPKATIGVSPEELSFIVSGPVGGPWPIIPSQTFDVVNTGLGASVLDFQIQKLIGNSEWLTGYFPTNGTLSGGAGTVITVTTAPTNTMMPGTYEEVLRVSGYSSNSYVDLPVILTIA